MEIEGGGTEAHPRDGKNPIATTNGKDIKMLRFTIAIVKEMAQMAIADRKRLENEDRLAEMRNKKSGWATC